MFDKICEHEWVSKVSVLGIRDFSLLLYTYSGKKENDFLDKSAGMFLLAILYGFPVWILLDS